MAKGGGASRPRFRLLLTALLAAAILLVPAAVYAWGRTSSSFTIRRIEVSGTHIVPERQVLRLLRRDYLGRNLFTVSSGAVRATLAPLCYVAGAEVARDFPDALRVRVVEHVPALYALSGSRWDVVSTDGRVVCDAGPAKEATGTAVATAALESTGTAPAATGAPAATSKVARLLATLEAGPPAAALQLPRIIAAAGLRPGSSVTDADMRDALEVLAVLPHAVRERVSVVQVAGKGQLTFRLDGGLLVVWGDTQRSVAKTVALRTVLVQYAQTGQTCTFMDVSVPDRVLARPVLK